MMTVNRYMKWRENSLQLYSHDLIPSDNKNSGRLHLQNSFNFHKFYNIYTNKINTRNICKYNIYFSLSLTRATILIRKGQVINKNKITLFIVFTFYYFVCEL